MLNVFNSPSSIRTSCLGANLDSCTGGQFAPSLFLGAAFGALYYQLSAFLLPNFVVSLFVLLSDWCYSVSMYVYVLLLTLYIDAQLHCLCIGWSCVHDSCDLQVIADNQVIIALIYWVSHNIIFLYKYYCSCKMMTTILSMSSRSPLTGALLIIELTKQLDLTLPLIVSTGMASLVSKILTRV